MASERHGLAAVLVEAFSSRACSGNGAAVVLLDQPAPAAWMQGLARSLAQSETAFLLEAPQGWLLRWFTPSCEVALCGHATLAALLALGHWGRLTPGQAIAFHSRSGPLEVCLDRERQGWGSLVLPSPGLQPLPPPASLLALLACHGLSPAGGFWGSRLGYQVVLLEPFAPLASLPCLAGELRGSLRDGLVLMQALPPPDPARTAPGSPLPPSVAGVPADYQLRFFAPGLGIPEDPVTGSAHALVAPLWLERLGRSRVVGWQCSDRPGGMLCEAAPSGMIRLTGAGHLLWEGTLRTDWPPVRHGRNGDCGHEPSDSGAGWSDWLTVTRCG